MAMSSSNTDEILVESKKIQHHEEDDNGMSFDKFGLDSRLISGLQRKHILKPTPIQHATISLIIEGKNVIVRAKNGSGKTLAYLIAILQKLLAGCASKTKTAPTAVILAPSRDLCNQVHSEVSSLIELCEVHCGAVVLTGSMTVAEMNSAMTGEVGVIVSTPACLSKLLADRVEHAASISDSLSILVIDDADLMLSYGYEEDMKALKFHLPVKCQCLLLSATSSNDVDVLKNLLLHDPYIITLSETGDSMDEIVPKEIQQFLISCSRQDKLLHFLAILKLELVQKKVLIFTNAIDMSYRLKLFLQKFSIKSSVLNPELPRNSRTRVVEEFNAGLFDFLIAADDVEKGEKGQEKPPKRYKKHGRSCGAVKGINFKRVYTVINFELPLTASGYIDRILHVGKAHNACTFISLACPEDITLLNEAKSFLGIKEDGGSALIAPFPLLTRGAVESLRYRAEDLAKSVTRVSIREARAGDLRTELLNSEKLKAHFEENPRDLDLLKRDKAFFNKLPSRHSCNLPDYLLDSTTHEAIKAVKLARAAMGNSVNARRSFRWKFKGTRTSYAGAKKKGSKREQNRTEDDNVNKKRKRKNSL